MLLRKPYSGAERSDRSLFFIPEVSAPVISPALWQTPLVCDPSRPRTASDSDGPTDGAGLVCPRNKKKGRLFLDPRAVGEGLRQRTAVEHEWRRWLDEQARLSLAAHIAEADEDAGIAVKVSQYTQPHYRGTGQS